MKALGLRLKMNLNLFFLNPEYFFRIMGFFPESVKINQKSNKLHSRLLFFKEKIILICDKLSTSNKFKILCFEIK